MRRSLIGVPLPNVALPSTAGGPIRLSEVAGRAVVFFYPYTGKPGYADPVGWDNIAGAHGSTPQALAFSEAYDAFAKLDVKVFGVSFQSTEWQSEFIARNAARLVLLSDADRKLAAALGLETFKAGPDDYLVRRTLVVNSGLVTYDFNPVPVPAANAVEVLKVLQA